MIMYRASAARYANELSGEGAKINGGRWNSQGIAGLYTSQYISLCMLEILARTTKDTVPQDYQLVTIELPDEMISEIQLRKLKPDWSIHFQYTQWIGDEFLKSNQALALRLPSAIVPQEHNFLINPASKNFKRVKIIGTEPLELDKRLFGIMNTSI